MPFPSPPWELRGTLWLSLFAVRAGTTARPAGLYGAAFVDYRPPGVLSYQELLVARAVRAGAAPGVTITDIWVNSSTSLLGGRSLWAIPKELADLGLREARRGPVASSAWTARTDDGPLAEASFRSLPAPPVRTPFRFSVMQTREDGRPVVTPVSGSARSLPCSGRWAFDPQGPLAWLAGRSPFLSLRFSDFRISFGR